MYWSSIPERTSLSVDRSSGRMPPGSSPEGKSPRRRERSGGMKGMGTGHRVTTILAASAILVASCGGSALYIYKGASFKDPSPAPAYTVNLGEAALGVGDGVGKHGHSIAFNPAMTHAVISYVDSGHVQVIRASDRRVVASIEMTGSTA